MRYVSALLVVLIILLTSACSSTPWSEVDGSLSKAGDNMNHDLIISSVDGKMFFDNKIRRKFDPGFRYIQLTTTNSNVKPKFATKPFPIQAKPCTKYYVSGRQSSSSRKDSDNWRIVVLREEPIVACEKLLDAKTQ